MITINGWSDTFENADTKKRQRLGWHLTPSGCESRGYRRLMRQGAAGLMAFGVFRAMCQALATLPKKTRIAGRFTNSDDSPMDVDDLAELTRIDSDMIAEALPLLEQIGWIASENGTDTDDLPEACQSRATSCGQSASRVPKNSGFVKGEGEGEGEDPPTPRRGNADDDLLDKFWKAYPRKGRERARSREAVRKAWRKVKASERPSESILLRSVALWEKSDHWQQGFVCGAHLFIRDKMWLDAPEEVKVIGAGFATAKKPTPAPQSDDFDNPADAAAFLETA